MRSYAVLSVLTRFEISLINLILLLNPCSLPNGMTFVSVGNTFFHYISFSSSTLEAGCLAEPSSLFRFLVLSLEEDYASFFCLSCANSHNSYNLLSRKIRFIQISSLIKKIRLLQQRAPTISSLRTYHHAALGHSVPAASNSLPNHQLTALPSRIRSSKFSVSSLFSF